MTGASKRTTEQMAAYIAAVIAPDLIAGGDAAERHSLMKDVADGQVTGMMAYLHGEPVIKCSYAGAANVA